jgi:hypothetical protein
MLDAEGDNEDNRTACLSKSLGKEVYQKAVFVFPNGNITIPKQRKQRFQPLNFDVLYLKNQWSAVGRVFRRQVVDHYSLFDYSLSVVRCVRMLYLHCLLPKAGHPLFFR